MGKKHSYQRRHRNGYMTTVHRQVVDQGATYVQMCLDAAMMAANEVLSMGPTRVPPFTTAYSCALTEIADMTVDDDGGIVVVKKHLDERLQKICGPHFQPYDERYEGAKDIIHDAAVNRLLQRIRELERENERLREALHGAH